MFGGNLIFKISETELIKYLNKVAIAYSNITANKKRNPLKMVVKKAIQMHALKYDPILNIKRFSEKYNQRNRFLLPTELNSLISAAKKGKAKYYLPALILLGAEHGAAKQECLGLQWNHIDFYYKGIEMIQLFRSKNHRQRTQYLMPRTKIELIRWRDHLLKKRGNKDTKAIEKGHVFCRIDGRPINGFGKSFRQACKIANLEDFRFHDLRHTFCTNLLLSGSDLSDVKELIGHSDIRRTDRYTHSMIERKAYLQERLARYYEGGWKKR